MSTTMMYLPREHATTSMRGTSLSQRNQTIQLGTYADGQRAVRVTVTYSPRVGSWGDVERKEPVT
jgi:hypothetical protein